MHNTLRIATFNIHKGVSIFNARLMLHEQRELIRKLHADIVFLQEVRGSHARHRKLTTGAQYEFLADSVWSDSAYGQNAVRHDGHHGNAILSKFPIMQWENEDISASPAEQRGLLHCEIAIPGWDQPLHCICVHLGLFSIWRRQQLAALNNRINKLVPKNAPLIIAGDFNDWTQKATGLLIEHQHLKEVFEVIHGKHARSFPALFPLLRLDRIYTRGFHIQHSEVHGGIATAHASDHAALSATLYKL
ncbi:MAG: endonuclease/exonuclease/phosphatase family protein [Methylophilaceae bacterium]|nr:endonuclease/exonuclease/phosphatase family protein [Methylophilaceae bacterium]